MQYAEFGTIGYAQINALSWRVASELNRRDPAVFIGLTGCGSGDAQADALMLTNGQGIVYHARRMGSGFVAVANDRDYVIPWNRALKMGSAKEIAMAMERSVGINLPEKAPTTSRRALGYRVLASFLEISLGDRHSWTVGEMEGGPLCPSTPAERELRLKDFEATRWVLRRDESPVATLDNFGFLEIDGRLVDLHTRYQELNRKLHPLTLDVFGSVLP